MTLLRTAAGFNDPDRHDELPAATLRSFLNKSYEVAGVEIPTIAVVPFGIDLNDAVEGLAPR